MMTERAKASEARGALCLEWKAECEGQKKPAIRQCDKAKPYDRTAGLDLWFEQRGFLCTSTRWLTDTYEEDEWFGEVRAYTICPEPDPETIRDWNDAYHGTCAYAVSNIARFGKLLAAEKKSLGHGTLTNAPGVYLTPVRWTGWTYALPQIMFDNGRWFRFLCHVKTNPELKSMKNQNRTKANKQWVHPENGVQLLRILVATHAPPRAGDDRLWSWKPHLEALVHGTSVFPNIKQQFGGRSLKLLSVEQAKLQELQEPFLVPSVVKLCLKLTVSGGAVPVRVITHSS